MLGGQALPRSHLTDNGGQKKTCPPYEISQVGRVRFFCAAKKRNPTFTLMAVT